ncbi:MAG: phosphoglycerate kinase [bacterium]
MKLKTVREIEIKNKRVVMRVDYNVSLGKGLKVVDDTRITHTIPTIKYLLERGNKIILMSHLGRPEGKPDPKLSLRPVAKHLGELLGEKIGFGETAEECNNIKERVGMLENLRFWPGEEENESGFARELASMGEIYVDDAFGAAHRAHASIVGIAKLLPAVAGLSLNYEVETILKAVETPKKPLVVIVGGAKVKDKIGMLFKLVQKADQILIGGGMANTFLCAKGYSMGKSFCELKAVEVAKQLLETAEKSKTLVMLPSDVIVGDLKTGKNGGVKLVQEIKKEEQALDIGPRTQVVFGKVIAKAKTIIWNGPMGVFEEPQFAIGTDYIFHALTENPTAQVVVGGGDTLAAINKQEHLERIDHISTGGGAMLELIEKGTLPGIEVLKQ